ncbi:MAG: family 10 glycosylhydrolase [Bacilli bacterium]|jgi:uncharacterized lipoprotein YddW (UPF0748 family)|nr:family 10 glycosylhydrolase [Bacilli bacterium]
MKKKIGLFILAFLLLGGCKPPLEEEKSYQVVFFDAYGEVLSTQEVKEGQSAVAPLNPIKDGFEFKGWDQEFIFIESDMQIHPIMEEIIPVLFEVTFWVGEEVYYQIEVEAGENTILPSDPTREGYEFMGWDKSTDHIASEMNVYPVWKKIPEPLERIDYASYVDNFQFNSLGDATPLYNQITGNDIIFTLTDVVYGEFRLADQYHVYEAANYRTRNSYGFEVAIDEDGIVIEKNVLVALPQNGWILSGHSSTATYLQNNVRLGDYLQYNKTEATVTGYRNTEINNVIALKMTIEEKITMVLEKDASFKALDYQLMVEKINQAIQYFNELLVSYQDNSYALALGLLNDVSFLMVEGRAIQTRAFWHYPLRSSLYPETSLQSVQNLLDQVKYMGFNTIYINTNFNGSSIYSSAYLVQRLAGSYQYGSYQDYLECFVEEAHLRGIQVIAWTNTLICGDGSVSTYYTTRNWVQIGYQGENNTNGMYYLDISNPEVQAFLENVFFELADNYNLDGIEFDFIRYPSGNLYQYSGVISNTDTIKDAGYTASFMNAFLSSKGLTGSLHQLLAESESLRTEWLNYKRSLLNDTVLMLVETIHRAKPNMLITAAVMPSATTANNVYLQDWRTWIEMGWVDILDPMVYTGDTNSVLASLTAMNSVVGDKASIVAGIYPDSGGVSLEVVAYQMEAVQSEFSIGWCKFSGRSFLSNTKTMGHYQNMKRHYTLTPNHSEDDLVRAFQLDLLDKIENYYQYKDTDNYTALTALLMQLTNDDAIINQLTLLEQEINELSNSTIKEHLLSSLNILSDCIA